MWRCWSHEVDEVELFFYLLNMFKIKVFVLVFESSSPDCFVGYLFGLFWGYPAFSTCTCLCPLGLCGLWYHPWYVWKESSPLSNIIQRKVCQETINPNPSFKSVGARLIIGLPLGFQTIDQTLPSFTSWDWTWQSSLICSEFKLVHDIARWNKWIDMNRTPDSHYNINCAVTLPSLDECM